MFSKDPIVNAALAAKKVAKNAIRTDEYTGKRANKVWKVGDKAKDMFGNKGTITEIFNENQVGWTHPKSKVQMVFGNKDLTACNSVCNSGKYVVGAKVSIHGMFPYNGKVGKIVRDRGNWYDIEVDGKVIESVDYRCLTVMNQAVSQSIINEAVAKARAVVNAKFKKGDKVTVSDVKQSHYLESGEIVQVQDKGMVVVRFKGGAEGVYRDSEVKVAKNDVSQAIINAAVQAFNDKMTDEQKQKRGWKQDHQGMWHKPGWKGEEGKADKKEAAKTEEPKTDAERKEAWGKMDDNAKASAQKSFDAKADKMLEDAKAGKSSNTDVKGVTEGKFEKGDKVIHSSGQGVEAEVVEAIARPEGGFNLLLKADNGVTAWMSGEVAKKAGETGGGTTRPSKEIRAEIDALYSDAFSAKTPEDREKVNKKYAALKEELDKAIEAEGGYKKKTEDAIKAEWSDEMTEATGKSAEEFVADYYKDVEADGYKPGAGDVDVIKQRMANVLKAAKEKEAKKSNDNPQNKTVDDFTAESLVKNGTVTQEQWDTASKMGKFEDADGNPTETRVWKATGKPISKEFNNLVTAMHCGVNVPNSIIEQMPEWQEALEVKNKIESPLIEAGYVSPDKKKIDTNRIPDNTIITAEGSPFRGKTRGEMRNMIREKMLAEEITADINEALKPNKKDPSKTIPPYKVKQEKRICLVTGLPAAGKSSAFVNELSVANQARVVDSDTIKQMLPEFANGYGANAVHEESSKLNDDVLDEAMYRGDNIVYPLLGKKAEKLEGLLKKFKDAGYTVDIKFNHLDPEKAKARQVGRFLTQNRFLPLECQDAKMEPAKAFMAVKDKFDHAEAKTNDVPMGEKPKSISYENLQSAIDNYGKNAV